MEKLNYYQVKVLCDSSHFDIDFNTLIGKLQKEFGTGEDNIYPMFRVCQLIKGILKHYYTQSNL